MAYVKQNKIKNGEILKAEYLNAMEDALVESFCKQRTLSSNDNLDEIRTVGEYYWSYAAEGTPINAPADESTMALSVFVADSGIGAKVDKVICQLAKSVKYGIFYRMSSRNTGDFSGWVKLDAADSSGIASYVERKARLMGEDWTRTFTIEGSTYPKYGGDSTGYIAKGTSQTGIIYSSTFRDGTDVLWNFNTSTYYSAVANPASVLYTKDFRHRIPNVYNEAAYMGSVCSSTALKACGYKYPISSSEIASSWREKKNHHIDNIEVGDILWKSGHVAGVIGVKVGADSHVKSVTIIEQAGSVKVFEKTASEWDDYFTYWTTIYRGDEAFDEVQELPKVFPENLSIIYEGGNNTYVTDYSKMLFYIPSATTVYMTKDDITKSYNKTSFPTEKVNNITVYNLASLFNGVGDYYLHTDVNTTDICIKVINKGSIVIEGNTATLSEYSNCKPIVYRIIQIIPENDTSYNFYGAPEGYTSQGVANTFEDIKDDIFEINNIPDHGKYKIEVFFDTEYGWARHLSDNIM